MSELILKKQNSQNEDVISRFDYLIRLPFQDHNAIEPHLLTDIDFRSGFLNKFPELSYIEHLQIESSILNDFLDSAKTFIIEFLVQMKLKLPFEDEILGCCEVLQLKNIDENSQKNGLSLARPLIKRLTIVLL